MSIFSRKTTANWKKAFSSTVARFTSDQGGQFAVIFAVSSLAITMAGGVALDTARMYSAKTKLNQAIDAAVLATTRDLTTGAIAEEDAEEAVGNFLYANMDANAVSGATVKIDDIDIDTVNKTLEIDAHLMLPMTLTAIAGWNEVKVASNSKAVYADDKIEVTMALDVTGSMRTKLASGERRIDALKKAAKVGFSALLPDETAKKRVRIGLVPYSASVNVTPVQTKISIFGGSNGCVVERVGPQEFSDHFATPSHPVIGTSYNTTDDYCPENEIVPMTNDIGTLNANVEAFSHGGTTAGHVGIAWARYLLSANWNKAWPAASAAASASDKTTKKFAVIMTDGLFNTFLSAGENYSKKGEQLSREYALGLCDDMKAGKIRIFTIFFNDGDPTKKSYINAKSLMEDCASPNTASQQFFFNATDAAELEKAFKAIAKGITSLRLVS